MKLTASLYFDFLTTPTPIRASSRNGESPNKEVAQVVHSAELARQASLAMKTLENQVKASRGCCQLARGFGVSAWGSSIVFILHVSIGV